MIVNYELVITTVEGNQVVIKSTSIEKIDLYTRQFKNKEELIKDISENEKIQIKDIYIKYMYKDKEKRLIIMYCDNVFDKDSVKLEYRDYLITHPEALKDFLEILSHGLVVRRDPRTDHEERCNEVYRHLGSLNSDDIYLLSVIINSFFKDSYRKYRDIYFNLLSRGIKCKTKPVKYPPKKEPNPTSNHLKNYTSSNELLEYALRTGDMDYVYSLFDNDNLQIESSVTDKPLIDSVLTRKINYEQEIKRGSK